MLGPSPRVNQDYATLRPRRRGLRRCRPAPRRSARRPGGRAGARRSAGRCSALPPRASRTPPTLAVAALAAARTPRPRAQPHPRAGARCPLDARSDGRGPGGEAAAPPAELLLRPDLPLDLAERAARAPARDAARVQQRLVDPVFSRHGQPGHRVRGERWHGTLTHGKKYGCVQNFVCYHVT